LNRAIIWTDGTGQSIEEMTGYDTKVYSSFERCFNDLADGKRDTAQVSEEEVQNYKDLAQDKKFMYGLSFIKAFEMQFTCSGICKQSLFYYTLPLWKGPPTNTCILHMKNVIQNNLTYMGLSATLCGLVMIFMWICQYTLWKKKYYEE